MGEHTFIFKIRKHLIFPFLTGCIDAFIYVELMGKRSKKERRSRYCEQNLVLHACMAKFGSNDNGSLHFDALNIYDVRKC